MEQDKALLRFGSLTVIETQITLLSHVFPELFVVTNTADNYKTVNVRVVEDLVPDAGPLGGLYTGLRASSNPHSFLIACDMPLINLGLVEYMTQQLEDNDIVIPVSSRGLEALFAIYSVRCLETIHNHLEDQNLKLINILDFHRVRYISQQEISQFDPDERSFFNMNNPEDYQVAKRIWSNSRSSERTRSEV